MTGADILRSRRSSLRSYLGVGLMCLWLAGCRPEEDPPVSRDCTGFENPNADQWMPFVSNAEGAFEGPSGEIRSLRVTHVETQGPYRETQNVPDATHVNCLRTSTLTLTHSDDRITTTWDLVNIEERQGQPIAEQRLTLLVTTSVAAAARPPYPPSYGFRLEDPADPYNSTSDFGVGHAYHPTRTIDGVVYSDVLEASVQRSDNEYEPLSIPDADWVRIVIARGVGLVQYELRNGQVFTRRP